MTPERFQTIVDAYGADPRRWPSAERADAEAWAAAHLRDAHARQAASADLDAWLDRQTVAAPDPTLQQRIVDSAPRPSAPRRPRAGHRGWWWSGAAVAGVGLAGGLAGAFAVSFFVLTGSASAVHDTSYLTTSFGGSSADWSDE